MKTKNITLHPCNNLGQIDPNTNLYPKTNVNNVVGLKDFLSIERLGEYIYKVTFDSIPEYEPLNINNFTGGCTSFVRDGKLYRNLDWNYDNTAEFVVKCKNFEGTGFIPGLTDGEINRELVGQLPYHLNDGRNNDGIMVSTHILFNDWEFDGSGNKNVPITTLPFHILNELHNINDIEAILFEYLTNISIPAQLVELGYLIQYLVTDGTTTYAILPGEEGYTIENITSNPKLTNFRWVNNATVVRGNLQERPTGIERWNEIGTVSSSTIALSDLRFTKAYEGTTRLSEFIGISGTTKDSTDAELTEIYNIAHAKYLQRTRNGELWQTVHSVIYGESGIEHLWVQENYNKDYAEMKIYKHIATNSFGMEYVAYSTKKTKFVSSDDAKNNSLVTYISGNIVIGYSGTTPYIVQISNSTTASRPAYPYENDTVVGL